MIDFLEWYSSMEHIKHKIYVPGNHDTSVEKGLIDFSKYPNITVLINQSVEINGKVLYGSPITPSFGIRWSYNCKRGQIYDKYWKNIPNNTNILITHGPPYGILDFTNSGERGLKSVGCKELTTRLLQIKPEAHIFGHLHDEKDVINHGIRSISNVDTMFINASIVNLQGDYKNNGIVMYF